MARKSNTPVDDEQNGSTRCVESVAAIGAVSSVGAPPDLSGPAPGRTALSDLARLLARQAARSFFSNISDHPQVDPVPTGRPRNGGDTNGRD